MLNCVRIVVLVVAVASSALACKGNKNGAAAPGLASATQGSRRLLEPAVDWKHVKPVSATDVSELVLWLKADEIDGVGDGEAISGWKDASRAHNDLVQKDPKSMPRLKQNAVNGKPAVQFLGRQAHLAKAGIRLEGLMQAGKTAIFLVLRPDSGENAHDAFGWGDCANRRFLTHLPYANTLHFQVGAPSAGALSAPKPAQWDGAFHIVSVVRNDSDARMDADGRLVAVSSAMSGELSAGDTSNLMIGNSPCGNGFNGEIAEVLIFNGAPSDAQRQGITAGLARKYGLPLQ